ncbi:hypothetical protein like AT1G04645 [Hibiscus trionum]|uniref:S-protein homolog n=1 Tax=Hibiscus trionum TaxID=183268 RepID=A0A9W7HN97_HIBTR|nr:hypothetical protein like AT1G04645 [Hibiscus trionum]
MVFPTKNLSFPLIFFMLLLAWGDCIVVRIKNDIGQGNKLTVHCQSGDDNLGKHVIPFGGEWDFTFSNNWRPWPWGSTTLFHCGFSWQREFKRFDIYNATRDFDCEDCQWSITPDGPCGDMLTPYVYSLCYPWD